MSTLTRRATLALAGAALAAPALRARAAGNAPGVSDKEIVFGQTMPYSGPASSYGTIGRAEANYFKMINDQGGIGGRTLTFISLDDGYSPPRTVELARRLIEQDKVAFLFSPLGTPTNTASRKYINERKVPDLFLSTGATQFGDRAHFPWTIGFQPTYQTEGHIYANHILNTAPDAKIAVLLQNDDSGKDYFKGLSDGLGAHAEKMIIAKATYEVTDPTVESQVVSLKDSGADVLFMCGVPRFAAVTIRNVYDIAWRPRLFIISSTSSSVATGVAPAGVEKAKGVITTAYLKDPTDPQWANDDGFKNWSAWMDKYYSDGDRKDVNNVYGYTAAQALVQTLKQCGKDLSRDNIMSQALNLDLTLPMLQPGVRVKTSQTEFYPLRQMRLVRFDGAGWVPFGAAVTG